MADLVDQATALADEHIAHSLARVDRVIPAGVAGECEECGEQMPRLVDGLCGFCRDGRRPPLEQYPVVCVQPSKENAMPNPPPSADRRQISFPATGAVLAEIMRRADGRSIAAATIELIEQGLETPAAANPALADYHTDALLDELRSRTSGGARVQELEHDLAAATDRVAAAEAAVEAAEGRLARVGAILAGAQ